MTYWHGLIISRTKRLNFWQKFLHFIFCQKILSRVNSNNFRWRQIICTQRKKSPCFNSRCIMDWNVSSLSHVWTFLNMMNREYLVENFQVLYNCLFRNFQFSNFNFFQASESWSRWHFQIPFMMDQERCFLWNKFKNIFILGWGTEFDLYRYYLTGDLSKYLGILEKNSFSEHI